MVKKETANVVQAIQAGSLNRNGRTENSFLWIQVR